jgi:hypothetical protein
VSDTMGLTITCGGEEYGIQWFPPKWTRNKGSYWYLVRFEGSTIHTLARFRCDEDARAFMGFLKQVVTVGREV